MRTIVVTTFLNKTIQKKESDIKKTTAIANFKTITLIKICKSFTVKKKVMLNKFRLLKKLINCK